MAYDTSEVISDDYSKGWREGIGIAITHIKSQHTVWDQTPIPASVLLDILIRNLEELKKWR